MSAVLDSSAARSRTRLLALSVDLLELSGDWTQHQDRASKVVDILGVVDKLLEEGRSINHLLPSYLKVCVSSGSTPTSGDLRVITALTDDFRASAALVTPAFDEGGASGCEISHPDPRTEDGPKESVKAKKKRKSRHLKPPKKVIGTLHGIQDLPQELLDLICDHVTGSRDSKNLRLVAKCFADRAAVNVSILSGTLSFQETSALFWPVLGPKVARR